MNTCQFTMYVLSAELSVLHNYIVLSAERSMIMDKSTLQSSIFPTVNCIIIPKLGYGMHMYNNIYSRYMYACTGTCISEVFGDHLRGFS